MKILLLMKLIIVLIVAFKMYMLLCVANGYTFSKRYRVGNIFSAVDKQIGFVFFYPSSPVQVRN